MISKMTFDPASVDPEHWAEALYTWAQLENLPEEVLGYICFSNFLASIQEDLSAEPEWALGLLEQYLSACCEDNQGHMHLVRWVSSSRNYIEGLYSGQFDSWEVFEARDLGLYQVAVDILENNFEKTSVAQHLTSEIRKKIPKVAVDLSNVN